MDVDASPRTQENATAKTTGAVPGPYQPQAPARNILQQGLRGMNFADGIAALKPPQIGPQLEQLVMSAQTPLRQATDPAEKTSVYVPRGATVEVLERRTVAGKEWRKIRYTLDPAKALTGWVTLDSLSPAGTEPESLYRDDYEEAALNEKGKVARPEIEAQAALVFRHKARYLAVSEKTGMPWYVIGLIHLREASCNFNGCLQNGDPIGKKTIHVPKGLLFHTWEESAIAALRDERGKFTKGLLEGFERYNGLGYRKRGKASPYVWSGTDKYKKGKYVGDGSYSANTVDAQAGTAAVLKAMEDKGYCVVDHGML